MNELSNMKYCPRSRYRSRYLIWQWNYKQFYRIHPLALPMQVTAFSTQKIHKCFLSISCYSKKLVKIKSKVSQELLCCDDYLNKTKQFHLWSCEILCCLTFNKYTVYYKVLQYCSLYSLYCQCDYKQGYFWGVYGIQL